MGNVHLASKTLAAIEEAIARDQGAAYRGHLGRVIPHMGDAYRDDPNDSGFRKHMGASLIGGECGRAIWYGFHWATKGNFTGRLLRLFNRGHLEEARMIACLLTIGCTVYQQDAEGKQFRISDVGGHFGGSGDGVAIGIPDLPQGTAALLEFKTHNDKSFVKLVAEGVRGAKFEHYVQMQTYMQKMGLAAALYLAVNKNNDELYGEIIPLESSIGQQFTERARTIIMLQHEAPSRMNESPGFFKCKWCNHYGICHQKRMPERNCRTCLHSQANTADGQWYCTAKPEPVALNEAQQLAGCSAYTVGRSYG
jgi:hypothetical protein